MRIRLKAVYLIVIVTAALAWGCAKSSPSVTYHSTGVIKAIDVKSGEVRIDHEDIPGFMSAMQMSFEPAGPSVVSGISVGDKVSFVLERTESGVKLSRMEKIAETASVNSAELFSINCAECHGDKGEGSKKGIPLISGHALVHSEKEFIDQVTNGEDDKMPAFRGKLTADEIEAVVKYVRTVIQVGAKADPMIDHKH